MRPFQPACWCLIIIILSVDVQPRHMTLTNMVHGHREVGSEKRTVKEGQDFLQGTTVGSLPITQRPACSGVTPYRPRAAASPPHSYRPPGNHSSSTDGNRQAGKNRRKEKL
ncbi:unnamed protein product [Arctogadus glacialis]